METLSYVRTVLWAFFGVGRRSAASDQLAKGKPLVLITVALALAALLGLILWGLANIAVQSLSAEFLACPPVRMSQAEYRWVLIHESDQAATSWHRSQTQLESRS